MHIEMSIERVSKQGSEKTYVTQGEVYEEGEIVGGFISPPVGLKAMMEFVEMNVIISEMESAQNVG